TVVPWAKISTSATDTPSSARPRCTASAGSVLFEGTLCKVTLSSSMMTMSVFVPPMSTPARRISVNLSVGSGQLGPLVLGGGQVDRIVDDDDPVHVVRVLDGDVPLADVLEHRLGGTAQRRTVPAATAR